MIEWKRVDKDNPPKGKHLFIYDQSIYEGWIFDEIDDRGYPMWEGSEGFPRAAYEVRWYAEINLPTPIEPKE